MSKLFLTGPMVYGYKRAGRTFRVEDHFSLTTEKEGERTVRVVSWPQQWIRAGKQRRAPERADQVPVYDPAFPTLTFRWVAPEALKPVPEPVPEPAAAGRPSQCPKCGGPMTPHGCNHCQNPNFR